MNFDIRPLFAPSYWLTTRAPEMPYNALVALFVLFAVVLIAGAALRVFINIRKEKDRYLKLILWRASRLGVGAGLLGFAWLFMAWQEIPFFGARFWLLAWALLVIAWGGHIAWYTWKKVPLLRAQEKERVEKLKYMPGRA